ncbi:MAG: polyprenyl synthetase family protein [Candidatus Omnitrophota bacterium]
MLLAIKNRIDTELNRFILDLDSLYSLNKISPLLFKSIKEFILRKGKRVRPTLLIISYLGFAPRIAPNLYRTAISLELLHDFMLVHDDIIDKSATRRGKPSMHEVFNKYLKGSNNRKFSGEDLAIVSGDVMYAMAIHAFLSVKENLYRKELALKKFSEAAFYTGGGEFLELLCGLKSIERMSKEDIYKIYDLKTANYTFASPLSIGAILAGASKKQVDIIFNYGLYLGRAFQVKDDITGMFETEKKIGKSTLTDLQEAKKTLLIWYAYHNSGNKNKRIIKRIFSKNTVTKADLVKIRNIILRSKALDYTKSEVALLRKKAETLIKLSLIKPEYRNALTAYANKIIDL